uniref:Uncharacterized protein n=1 Tax=Arundo donax TaxID=35708 RepID=A0A0A9BAZ7_ARUDO
MSKNKNGSDSTSACMLTWNFFIKKMALIALNCPQKHQTRKQTQRKG